MKHRAGININIHALTITMTGLKSPSKDRLSEESTYVKHLKTSVTEESLNPAPAAKSLQSCPTLCDPIDSSPPGSPIPGILQARTLEWVAISFSNA